MEQATAEMLVNKQAAALLPYMSRKQLVAVGHEITPDTPPYEVADWLLRTTRGNTTKKIGYLTLTRREGCITVGTVHKNIVKNWVTMYPDGTFTLEVPRMEGMYRWRRSADGKSWEQSGTYTYTWWTPGVRKHMRVWLPKGWDMKGTCVSSQGRGGNIDGTPKKTWEVFNEKGESQGKFIGTGWTNHKKEK